jgi:hypothetical protein
MSTLSSKIALLVFATLQIAFGQKPNEVRTTEPGIYKLSDLFNAADSVVLVKIVSGDTENYDTTIYKAKVLESFKGISVGQVIYFGPFNGERLGWEYVLFLQNISKPAIPKGDPNAGYGAVRYAQVFNEGYSSMMTSYECIFGGQGISQRCDYGVRVCTDYVLLPKEILTAPPITEETPLGCRFVRKITFMGLLRSLGSKGTGHLVQP